MNKSILHLTCSIYNESSKWGSRVTYSQVECSIHAECSLLGWEGLASTQDVVLVSCAGLLVADVAQGLLAAQCGVVWLTDRQEVRCQVPCHYLACVDKDVNSEEAKGVDSCREKQKMLSWSNHRGVELPLAATLTCLGYRYHELHHSLAWKSFSSPLCSTSLHTN